MSAALTSLIAEEPAYVSVVLDSAPLSTRTCSSSLSTRTFSIALLLCKPRAIASRPSALTSPLSLSSHSFGLSRKSTLVRVELLCSAVSIALAASTSMSTPLRSSVWMVRLSLSTPQSITSTGELTAPLPANERRVVSSCTSK